MADNGSSPAVGRPALFSLWGDFIGECFTANRVATQMSPKTGRDALSLPLDQLLTWRQRGEAPAIITTTLFNYQRSIRVELKNEAPYLHIVTTFMPAMHRLCMPAMHRLCTRVAKHQNTTGFAGDLRSQQQELTACVGFGESACIQEDQS
jgi:hypothetical protein